MTARRTLLISGFAALVTSGLSLPAFAASDRLLDDILIGITDALVRDYVRDHYREGQWDGKYWHYNGRRYTPEEYGRFMRNEYSKKHPPKAQGPKPQGPKPQPKPQQGKSGGGHPGGHNEPPKNDHRH